jgi:hypothetical protein
MISNGTFRLGWSLEDIVQCPMRIFVVDRTVNSKIFRFFGRRTPRTPL